jgi:FkbM family methyltransferase
MLEHEWDRKSVQFPLTEESVVLEIGGYAGRWALEIAGRFNPRLYVFEPQHWAYQICREKLLEYDNAKVFNFGLGTKSGKYQMHKVGTDSCSFVIPEGGDHPTGEGELVEISHFLETQSLHAIDVCLMNIEGYEFALIPHMLQLGLFDRIRWFMCQFHPFGENSKADYQRLRDELSEGRLIKFDYGTVLTCWERT